MAKKKTEEKTVHRPADPNVMGLRGTVVEQPITRTLDENYMPYAMSVIVSRAIPEIDGFKPSHRKLLYTMYKMGLLTGGRTKSANIVGQTMRLNPHGDQVQPIAKLCITHRFNALTVMGFSIILMSRSIRFRRAFSFLSSRGASTVFVLETANAPFLTENAVMGKCCIVHFEILLSHLIRINCYIDSPFELADLSVDCFHDG